MSKYPHIATTVALAGYPQWAVGDEGTVNGKRYRICSAWISDGLFHASLYRVTSSGKLSTKLVMRASELKKSWKPEARDAAE